MVAVPYERKLEKNITNIFASKHQQSVLKAIGAYTIEPLETFVLRQIIDGVQEDCGYQVAATRVQTEIEKLINLDMAICLASDIARPKEYTRIESPLWIPILTLVDPLSHPTQKRLEVFA
ncbi:MAG TPA: hypothetical protein VLF63_03725 [Patescibacteria group bacterium]|nr:hypothetical protein [Patescibacteria group bacterium]